MKQQEKTQVSKDSLTKLPGKRVVVQQTARPNSMRPTRSLSKLKSLKPIRAIKLASK